MSDMEELLPIYHGKNVKFNNKKMICYIKFPFYKFGVLSGSYSIFSFIFCVVWSIMYNFEEANATHCAVENYLPSISAAIGHFYPQIYMWNTMILYQMLPRIKISKMYLQYFNSIIFDKYQNLCYFVWLCQMGELWSLLGLSLVTSTSNYPFHAFCFITFLFSSMLYMILSCYLLKFKRKIPPENSESWLLKWKFKCCVFNIFCFLMAGYFFNRHNAYCEPKVYSLFALFEYGVVLSNMIFHMFAIGDFYDKTMSLSVSWSGIKVDYSPPFKSVQYAFK